MSVTNIDLKDLTAASRYLAGQLSDAERDDFEMELTRNPQTLQELEAAARFKVGLEKLRDRGELRDALLPTPWHRHPFAVALAASLAVLVIGIVLSRSSTDRAVAPLLAASASALVEQRGQVLRVGNTLAVFRRRAEALDAVIELPSTQQAVALRVLPETPAASGRYRLSLMQIRGDASIEAVGSVAGLRPDDEGFVTAFANASRLVPGRYRLVVSPDDVSGMPGGADAFVIGVIASPKN